MTRTAPKPLDMLALAGVSAALLALEVLLLRLFEFSHWYHFAGLAVSLALLGLGAAGTTLALAGRYRFTRGDGWFLSGLIVSAAGFLLLLALQSRVALRPVFAGWDTAELGALLLVDFVAFLPFYGAGMAIGQVFLRWPAHPRALYAANLLGSGAGSIGASLLLVFANVETALAVVALLLFAMGTGLAAARGQKTAGLLAGIGMLLALLATVRTPAPAVSDFKALSRIRDLPDAELLDVRPGLPGRLSVFRSDSLRFAPGLSLEWAHSLPASDAVVIGSDRTVPLARRWPPDARHADASLAGLPMQVRPDGNLLVLGSSAWQTPALAANRPVTWVEPDERILDLARQRGAEKADDRLIADSAWRYLATTGEIFEIVALDEAWAGGDAATENYVLTSRGLRLALARLGDRGLLAIPLRLEYPPRHFPRVLATLERALSAHGARDAGDHVAIVRGMQALTILASPEPLGIDILDRLERFAKEWRFDIAWHPRLAAGQTNRIHRLDVPIFYEIAKATFEGRALPSRARLFHTEAADLNRPYPWRSLEWSAIPGILEIQGGRGWSYLDWTLILTAVTAVAASLLAFLLILAPLGRLPPIGHPLTRMSVAGYFTALGLGYMLLELATFQRLILYLGEPVLTASVVFAVFLVGSGMGSAKTPAVGNRDNLRRVYAVLAAGLAVALVPFYAVETLTVPPFPVRAILLVLLLLPLAWAMGRPFPWGLARLETRDRWIPWAWGINGFASVVGASIAPLVSVHLGQHVTLLAGTLCYAGAYGIGRLRFVERDYT